MKLKYFLIPLIVILAAAAYIAYTNNAGSQGPEENYISKIEASGVRIIVYVHQGCPACEKFMKMYSKLVDEDIVEVRDIGDRKYGMEFAELSNILLKLGAKIVGTPTLAVVYEDKVKAVIIGCPDPEKLYSIIEDTKELKDTIKVYVAGISEITVDDENTVHKINSIVLEEEG